MSSLSIASDSLHVYKGKVSHRSWPQLPEEVIRLIATYYLWDAAANGYCPQTWEPRRHWYSRMAYCCLRDSLDLEKGVMAVCPEWHRAISTHLFWNQAISLIDPNDVLAGHMVVQPKNASSNAPPTHMTPHHHARSIIAWSCIVCRINHPHSTVGLTTAKRTIHSPFFGPVGVCREHDRKRTNFCGLCFRDTPTLVSLDITSRDYENSSYIRCQENEDEEFWPGVEATCRRCRSEWLWQRAGDSPQDREAIGGPPMRPADWETRQSVDAFLDHGEGTIAEVLALAREKHWLRTYTKYESLGLHALAAQQTSPAEDEEEDEDDIEDDQELMLMRDSSQVREMALHDWARQRILDGHWISPADVWYRHTVPGQPLAVRAIHPCPWTKEVVQSRSPRSSAMEEPDMVVNPEDEEHPHPSIVNAEIPPSFHLCELAYMAHMKQLREVLATPLKNVVRKIVMECSFESDKGYEDPAVKASKMSLDEVVAILREEEGIWYDGVDWIEKKRNELDALRRQNAQARATLAATEDDSVSTTSSGSENSHKSFIPGSNATSPVLSTTTLQTTPSPPPSSDDGVGSVKKDEDTLQGRYESRPPTIPVGPVRSPPQLLSSIPYIPITLAHMPPYSVEALRMAWRDACAPLYHCRCSICERAKLAMTNSSVYPASISSVSPSQQVVPEPPLTSTISVSEIPLTEIGLKEAQELDVDGDGEEEVDYDSVQLDEYDEEEEEGDTDSRYASSDERYTYSASPEVESKSTHSRKRSSDELESDDSSGAVMDDNSDLSSSLTWARDQRELISGTSPKRARTDSSDGLSSLILGRSEDEAEVPPNLARRQRKRSSEELDDDDVDGGISERSGSAQGNKRAKVEGGVVSPSSPLMASPISDYVELVDGTVPLEKDILRKMKRPLRRNHRASAERVIVLNDDEGGS